MLLNAVKGDPLEALYSVALAVGLRQGETLGLAWSDLDLDGGTLRVRTSLQVISGEFVFQEPKTKKSRRTITLPECAVSALRLHRARRLQDRLKAGSAPRRWPCCQPCRRLLTPGLLSSSQVMRRANRCKRSKSSGAPPCRKRRSRTTGATTIGTLSPVISSVVA